MLTATKTVITIAIAPGQSIVEIDQNVVEKWLDAATDREVDDLNIEHECDECAERDANAPSMWENEIAEELAKYNHVVGIYAGLDPGSCLDITRIQDAIANMPTEEILRRLTA